ncbi:subtilisin-like serine protease [Ceratobasidium sp. 395]|nr:subtilisin-like serine protease [Ceratobasidium sp. 395]
MFVPLALGALALVAPVLGAPRVIPITKRAGPVKPNSFIIGFHDAGSKDAFMAGGPSFTQPNSHVVYDYSIIQAVAVVLDPSDLQSIQQSSLNIAYIEPDGIVSIDYEVGLDTIDLEGSPTSLASEQVEKRTIGGGGGSGVNVYGIDTGIYTAHNCFGGRAQWGKTFGGYADADGNGHGTHTAGTAVGSGFPPEAATDATIFAVKVLSDQGSGSSSDVISGIQWSLNHCKESKKSCVANMSLGGLATDSSTDDAVKAAIAGGVHFAIAAGNSNVDASMSTPARVKEANTIGAVDSTNKKASFSNWGSLIDVWAPGVDITSAWIGSPDANNTISGTSMATPYVAAILAAALGRYGQMSPKELSDALKANAAKGVVAFDVTDTGASMTSTHDRAQLW